MLASPRRDATRAATITAALVATIVACAPAEEPAPSPSPESAVVERKVTFESGPDTIHATFATPRRAEAPMPAALLIAGSGPTDRDGNSPMRPDADTNRHFARVLADAGVASLRYDKVGSGRTGLASHGPDERLGYDLFETEMVDAYATLAARPEVDSSRLLVLGHSEGAFFALRSATAVTAPAPQALILAAPFGERYLSGIDRQLTARLRDAESTGRLGTREVTETLSDTRYAIARLRDGAKLPENLSPYLEPIFSPRNADFLARIDAQDPAEVARELPRDLPVLVLWGTADRQIVESEVDRLMSSLPDGQRVDLPGADHVFRGHDSSPDAPVLDGERPFSPGLAPAVTDFLAGAV